MSDPSDDASSLGSLPVRILNFISDRLGIFLDRAIQNIDRFREHLIIRFYRAIKYIEDFIRAVLDLLRVVLPIIIVFIPPNGGLYVAFFLYKRSHGQAIILLALCIVLLLIIILSFFASTNPKGAGSRRRRIDISKDLEAMGPVRRIFGVVLAMLLLGFAYYVSIGLFLGLVMFVVEFLAVLSLKLFYGTAAET